MSAALTFPPITTSTTAPTTNPVFVFGSSSNVQSKSQTGSAALPAALTFPPVTTSTTAPATNPLFVFGSSNNVQSKSQTDPTQVPAFSLSPPKFALESSSNTETFNFTLKSASSESNIFGSTTKLGSFNFTMKTATSVPNIFDNTNLPLLHPTGKETDSAEVDSQNDEWVTESESEYFGSELNLEKSSDNDDSEFVGTSVNNTLTDDIDTSVNTVVDQQQEGDTSLTKELSLDSQTHDSETQEQSPQ